MPSESDMARWTKKPEDGQEHPRGVRRPANTEPLTDSPKVRDDGTLVEFKGSMQRCTGTSKATGAQCRHWCQPGLQVCYFHGGPAAIANIKHGRASKWYRLGFLAKKVRKYAEDPHIKSLVNEVAVSRALLETYLEELRSIRDLDKKRTETILSAIEQIRRGVETMIKTEDGLRYILDVGQIERLAVQVLDETRRAVDKVCGEELADKVKEDLQQRIQKLVLSDRIPGR